jgi:hypothetical protein
VQNSLVHRDGILRRGERRIRSSKCLRARANIGQVAIVPYALVLDQLLEEFHQIAFEVLIVGRHRHEAVGRAIGLVGPLEDIVHLTPNRHVAGGCRAAHRGDGLDATVVPNEDGHLNGFFMESR